MHELAPSEQRAEQDGNCWLVISGIFPFYLRERPRYGNKASITHETPLIQLSKSMAGGFRQTGDLRCESWNDQTLLSSRTHVHTLGPED